LYPRVTFERIPLWLRALDRMAGVAERFARLVAAVRDESAMAWTPPSERPRLTSLIFDRQRSYAPGGRIFTLGLLGWEHEILAPPFPSRGRILIGGAGGGREVMALIARGYQVVAFDPAPELVRAGSPTVEAAGGTLLHASYADIVRAANGEPTPLGDVFATPFDGVLLGWGSLSLVITDDERLAILRALRDLVPNAPVALSFDEPAESEIPGSRVARARAAVRRLYARLGAPGYTGERMRYAAWAGILRESSIAEVAAVARTAGYDVAKQGSAQGRMLLLPAQAFTSRA
jgi:hypothetical protein